MNERLHAVQVAADYAPEFGGIPAVVSLFQDVFAGRVISFSHPQAASHRSAAVEHVPVGSGLSGRAYGWSSARRAAERELRGADLVVIHGLFRFHAQWGWSRSRQRQIPYWVVPHGALDPWVFTYRAHRKKAWLSLIGRRIVESATAVIYATEREREKASAYVDTRNGVVIPWPVSLPDSEPDGALRDATRSRLGIPADARVLLSLGRLHPMKRVIEIMSAVNACDDPDLHLVVVGPGSAELTQADCEQFARDSGQGRIHVVGPAFGSAKEGYFAAADGFINLSHRENFGVAVAEALSHGLPVILSPGNDLAAELDRAGCGWFTRSLELSEEAFAIQSFTRAPEEELLAMGAQARRWTGDNLTRSRFGERLLDLANRGRPVSTAPGSRY